MEALLIITTHDQLVRAYCTMTPENKKLMETAIRATQPEVTEFPARKLRMIITTIAGGAIILKGET